MLLPTLLILSVVSASLAIYLQFRESSVLLDSESEVVENDSDSVAIGSNSAESLGMWEMKSLRFFHIQDRDKYFEILQLMISKAKERIIIVDYVNHGGQMNVDDTSESQSSLNGYYTKYFSFIADTVRSRSLRYVRILCLPHSSNIVGDSAKHQGEEVLMDAAIQLLYNPTRAHILDVINEENFELYVQSDSRRPFSSFFIDDEVWGMELDEYGRGGLCRPDTIVINYNQSLKENLVQDEIERTMDSLSMARKITRNDITRTLAKLLVVKELQLNEEHQKREKVEKSIHELQETLEQVKVAAEDFV